MRTDFSSWSQSSIGFDRLFDLLESSSRNQAGDGWPAYNIEKLGEERYRITMAVAGFGPDDLEITKHSNQLLVRGKKSEQPGDSHVLYHGIATRSFERRFQLADFVDVAGADLANGLLVIDLVREVPEAMKPRRIELSAGSSPTAGRIEQRAA